LVPGDLLWFDSYVPHHSGTNVTDTSRRALYLTYNAASAGDFRSTYYEDKEATFAGLDGEADRARLSITDDFLGRPVS
jgi:ectoine hydroxylase-related dioxygenase (phytanoyl-CoA dioxygenase family)